MVIKAIGIEYKIQKRYNEFKELHLMLQRNYGDQYTFDNFPKKKHFYRFDNSVIKDRCEKFKDMLYHLCVIYQDDKITEFLDFLELYKHSEDDSIANVNVLEKQNNHSIDSEFAVLSYLQALNECGDNLIHIIGQFEEFFLTNKTKLSNGIIVRQLLGDDVNQGLFYICFVKGKDEMHQICSRCIQFLNNLFEHEYNRDAESFSQILAKLPVKKLLSYGIKDHLNFDKIRKCKKYSYQFISKYKQYNPNFDEFEVFGDIESYEKYRKWREFSNPNTNNNLYRSLVMDSIPSYQRSNNSLNNKVNLSGSMISNQKNDKNLDDDAYDFINYKEIFQSKPCSKRNTVEIKKSSQKTSLERKDKIFKKSDGSKSSVKKDSKAYFDWNNESMVMKSRKMSVKSSDEDKSKSCKRERLDEIQDNFIKNLKSSEPLNFKFPLVTESKPKFNMNENLNDDNCSQVYFEKEGLWIAKIEKLRKGIQINNEILVDWLWDDDAKEIKYQQKRDKAEYYKVKTVFSTQISDSATVEYKFKGNSHIKTEDNTVEICMTSSKVNQTKTNPFDQRFTQNSDIINSLYNKDKKGMSLASQNTEIDDVFELNLNIQLQFRLENLGFIKNIEIVIKALDDPTKLFQNEFNLIKRKLCKLTSALCQQSPAEPKYHKGHSADTKIDNFMNRLRSERTTFFNEKLFGGSMPPKNNMRDNQKCKSTKLL